MKIKALFASKNKLTDESIKFQQLPMHTAFEDKSALCMKLDNIIEYLKVYREDFQGKREPNYEIKYTHWRNTQNDKKKQKLIFHR